MHPFFWKKNKFFYSENTVQSLDPSSIYCPHPFTNWSLNPSHVCKGVFLHTKEGFMKTSDYPSIIEHFAKKNVYSIYCIGGSTTYCNELLTVQDPWPSRIESKLNNQYDFPIVVGNGGVGGWGTLQSLIRFSTWGTVLKPKLTIVYQSKNDLTPLYCGRVDEDKVFPDYSNIMLQFSTAISRRWKTYKNHNGGIGAVFSKHHSSNPEGLNRLNDSFLATISSRYQMIADMAKTWGGSVIFIPELMNGSAYYEPMSRIHEKMEKISEKNNNTQFFDIREHMPFNRELFWDKMHFTAKGCDFFANLVIPLVREHISRSLNSSTEAE
jgi:hypothetical protein